MFFIIELLRGMFSFMTFWRRLVNHNGSSEVYHVLYNPTSKRNVMFFITEPLIGTTTFIMDIMYSGSFKKQVL